MRRLGAELGAQAMTLYHYLPNKTALLDGLVELVVPAVRPSFDGPAGEWPLRLREFAVAFRAELLRHPGAITLVATRPVRPPQHSRQLRTPQHRSGAPGSHLLRLGGSSTPSPHW